MTYGRSYANPCNPRLFLPQFIMRMLAVTYLVQHDCHPTFSSTDVGLGEYNMTDDVLKLDEGRGRMVSVVLPERNVQRRAMDYAIVRLVHLVRLALAYLRVTPCTLRRMSVVDRDKPADNT